MHLHVFTAFVAELRACGMSDSCHIILEEQAAIFLYMCVTGLSIRHVGERFQHANETISKYVITIHSMAGLIFWGNCQSDISTMCS
jgi:hypothetical protein